MMSIVVVIAFIIHIMYKAKENQSLILVSSPLSSFVPPPPTPNKTRISRDSMSNVHVNKSPIPTLIFIQCHLKANIFPCSNLVKTAQCCVQNTFETYTCTCISLFSGGSPGESRSAGHGRRRPSVRPATLWSRHLPQSALVGNNRRYER